MRSLIKWALLGLVIERPSHAYELSRRLQRRFGSALALSDARQAYGALRGLVGRGLIEQLPPEPADATPKARYTATEEGLRHYGAWLVGQAAQDRRSHQLSILALSAFTRQPERMLPVIEEWEQAWVAHAMRTPITREQDGPDWLEPLFNRLLEEENRLTVGARLEWVQYAREQLSELLDEPEPARQAGEPPEREPGA
jgi:DNA-binding PadR family transcriptional regulator